MSSGTQNANLLSVPLFHATGCHAVLVTNTAAGGKLVMMHHFDPERALELIERERITIFGGVPAMVMQVIDSPNFAKRDTSSVRSISYGGAPVPARPGPPDQAALPGRRPGQRLRPDRDVGHDHHERRRRLRPQARQRRAAGPGVRRGRGARGVRRARSRRPTRPRTPSAPASCGSRGRTWSAATGTGPRRPPLTFTRGWLHTGDVARIDEEGFVHIVDRAKDMIIRGGENVYCVEVEAALFEHPAVADCAVIGVPHPVLGEEVGRRRGAAARRGRGRRRAGPLRG